MRTFHKIKPVEQISCQIESFKGRFGEFKHLFRDHWEEIASHKDSVPLDPAYSEYFAREELGQLIFHTLRDNGDPIGYYIGIVCSGGHHMSSLVCFTDAFYILPEYRKSGCGAWLFKSVESHLKVLKVTQWQVNFNHYHDLSGFLGKLGFKPFEVTYSKILGE